MALMETESSINLRPKQTLLSIDHFKSEFGNGLSDIPNVGLDLLRREDS